MAAAASKKEVSVADKLDALYQFQNQFFVIGKGHLIYQWQIN